MDMGYYICFIIKRHLKNARHLIPTPEFKNNTHTYNESHKHICYNGLYNKPHLNIAKTIHIPKHVYTYIYIYIYI